MSYKHTIATRYNPAGIKALDRGEAQITDEAYVNAAQTLYDLTKAGLFQASVTSTNYDQASEMFLSGKAAMFLNGQWYIEDATKALGDDVCWIASRAGHHGATGEGSQRFRDAEYLLFPDPALRRH